MPVDTLQTHALKTTSTAPTDVQRPLTASVQQNSSVPGLAPPSRPASPVAAGPANWQDDDRVDAHTRSHLDQSIIEPEPPTSDAAGPYADNAGTVPGTTDKFGQQRIPDCSTIAAIKAVAEKDPHWVQDHVKKVGTTADGKNDVYQVTLYNPDGSKNVHTLTTALPVRAASGVAETGEQNPEEMWGPMVEKALAAQLGGYGNLNKGPGEVMPLLTGRPSTSGATSDGMPDLGKHAVVVSGPRAGAGRYDPKTGERVPADRSPSESINLHENHAYAVAGTRRDPKTGETFVTLKNPWQDSDKDTGSTFEVPLSALPKLFTNYDSVLA